MRSKRRCVLEKKQPYSGDEWCSGPDTEEDEDKPHTATHRESLYLHTGGNKLLLNVAQSPLTIVRELHVTARHVSVLFVWKQEVKAINYPLLFSDLGHTLTGRGSTVPYYPFSSHFTSN